MLFVISPVQVVSITTKVQAGISHPHIRKGFYGKWEHPCRSTHCRQIRSTFKGEGISFFTGRIETYQILMVMSNVNLKVNYYQDQESRDSAKRHTHPKPGFL